MITLKLGEFELFWLNGGEFELDGGTMFGVVPKVLWSKKYPADVGNYISHEDNYLKFLNSPILIKTPGSLVLVETGLGNKLTKKQKQIFRVTKEWDLPAELKKLGVKRQDVSHVILTHCDFDHAGGIVMNNKDGKEELTFPNARHIVQKQEWHDALHPNIRSENTYWPQNFAKLQDSDNLQLIEGNFTVCKGIEVLHTGGHTQGHQIVRIQSRKEIAYHLADLMPTHVHFNPLWIMAYDNYPMEVISLKQQYEAMGIRENAWFTFYHDPAMYACKFDAQGNVVNKVAPETPHETTASKQAMHVMNLNVQKTKRVTLSCPECLLAHDIMVDKYMGRQHFLTVNCPCGFIYGVNLNFRKHYRKDTSIGGFFSGDDTRKSGFIDSDATVPINCRIKNISMGGLGFTTLDRMRVQLGDKLRVKFTLDKVPPETVEKDVIVRSIRDNYIGCEFADATGFTDRTLGFYLMK